LEVPKQAAADVIIWFAELSEAESDQKRRALQWFAKLHKPTSEVAVADMLEHIPAVINIEKQGRQAVLVMVCSKVTADATAVPVPSVKLVMVLHPTIGQRQLLLWLLAASPASSHVEHRARSHSLRGCSFPMEVRKRTINKNQR
jgi:hypothetical protein